MKKIKIAQIGAGHDHAPAAISVLQYHEEYDFVGFAKVPEDDENVAANRFENNKNAYQNCKQMTVEEIFNIPDLDAVCIETEDRALTKYATMAAEHGLHIQMDKPGGIDDKAFDNLIDLVKKKNLVFHTGYMYRYNPAVLKLKEDIKNGKLGEIYAVEAQMNCLHAPEKRSWLGNYPGGMLYYLGCHLIDLVYDICGEPQKVIPLSTPIHTDDVKAEDFGMAVFRYANGVSFVKSTAVEFGGFERRQLVVCGTKGTVELKPFEWIVPDKNDVFSPQTTGVREVFSEGWHDAGVKYNAPVHGRYDAMFSAFASYVNGEKENPFGYEYERALHKLVLKACGA